MNFRIGFFRIWLVLAVVWFLFSAYSFWIGCFYFRDSSFFQPICNTGNFKDGIPVAGYLYEFQSKDWISWLVRALGAPIAVLIFGWVVSWITKGFAKK